MNDLPDTPAAVERTREKLVELFGAVCADPDDTALCAAADGVLAELDGLLAAVAG
ncbi:hypothetical protein [Parafrankia sp. FMc2]|uniref:hypothetical protein n=1 Tax=Parafrankia sp. FMc2 TaxID=3233196 RepID=UPI0034D6E205